MKLNLLFFIRILVRNIKLLLFIPALMGGMVYVLTMNEAKVFNSNMRIFTGIASGSSSIELENSTVDFRQANTAYDNLVNIINSRKTLETVSLQLFTQHMLLNEGNPKIISAEKLKKLKGSVPEEVKKLIVPNNFEATYAKFFEYKNAGYANFLYELVNLDHPDYSIKKIKSKINVKRISNSDFLDVSYESEDSGICQNTLLILSEVFIKINSDIKINQSDAVIQYFEEQLAVSTGHLKQAEEELLDFNKGNNIINYYEQTKHIASEKEHFELNFQEVKMNYFAAKSVLSVLESKLNVYQKKVLSSQNVLELRNKISNIKFDSGRSKLNIKLDSSTIVSAVKAIENAPDIIEIKKALKEEIDTLYRLDFQTNGLSSAAILTDWLDNVIAFEGAKAQIAFMEERQLSFKQLFQEFAPLGATMKRLERKIDIAEREYLSLLHSLGLARLKQQNVALTSNLKLIEVPFYPIDPQPSKRIILIGVAVILGFVVVAFTLFLLEFFDSNLRVAKNTAQTIGLRVSSIFPVIKNDNKLDYKYLEHKAINAISRTIILSKLNNESDNMPMVHMLFSTQEGDGKTFISEHLIANLTALNYKVLHITYDEKIFPFSSNMYHCNRYAITDQLYKVHTIEAFDISVETNSYDFILIELPAIIKYPFPVKLAEKADETFLVTRANRPWTAADKNALALFLNTTNGPKPTIILNGVQAEEMETVIGELPKKRSAFRKWFKKLILFQLFSRKNIA